jgi:L-lactate dehydrogenase complex protein LldG
VVEAHPDRPGVSARDDVLHRLRSALGATPAASPGPVPRDYRTAGEHAAGSAPLLELLTDRLVDYKAQVRRAAPDGIAEAVAAALTEGMTGSAPTGDRLAVVVPDGLPQPWLQAADVEVHRDDGLSPRALDELDAVVTTAAVAVAETGTLVLDGSAGQGRRVITLVPDLHVCVVRADQVVQTVPEAVARLDPTRPLTWISGPSATSDIELVRVEGVHGPRRLQVVLVG